MWEMGDWNTREVKLRICDACVIKGEWIRWAEGATKTLLLVARGRLAEAGGSGVKSGGR